MHRLLLAAIVAAAASASPGCASPSGDRGAPPAPPAVAPTVHYLEIVTRDVDAMCAAYGAANGLRFGEPDPALGNARTAALPGGALVGVRAPMSDAEEPVVRPYFLVDDIDAAVARAVASGAELALPPMEIPGHGRCAIYFLGGVQHGLWQR